MNAVENLNRITNETASGLLDAKTAGARLTALEHSRLLYPK
jgi:hypothetical protein